MRLLLRLSTVCFYGILLSCSEEDPSFSCSEQAVISDRELDAAPNDEFVIQNLQIDGNFLLIRFGASGCDGDSWEVRLIGSELVMESLPPQRAMLLSLNNEEECEAFITKEVTFDITPTQAAEPSIWLNFIDTEERILYEYNRSAFFGGEDISRYH